MSIPEFLFCCFILCGIWFTIDEKLRPRRNYQKSTYFAQTQIPYNKVCSNPGLIGEYRVYCALTHVSGIKAFVHDVYLPKRNGGVTKIGIVFINESGVYIVNSKNYIGKIFGREDQNEWKQYVLRGNQWEKKLFYNPIMQNQGHVRAMRDILKDPSIPIYSYVVFGNNCTFEEMGLTTRNNVVVHLSGLAQSVNATTQRSKKKYSREEIVRIMNKINKYANPDAATIQAHANSIY